MQRLSTPHGLEAEANGTDISRELLAVNNGYGSSNEQEELAAQLGTLAQHDSYPRTSRLTCSLACEHQPTRTGLRLSANDPALRRWSAISPARSLIASG